MNRRIYIWICCMSLFYCLYARDTLAQIDAQANPTTQHLFTRLYQLGWQGKKLFGHQESLEYGVGWRYLPDHSDVYAVAGDYPAVLGCDLSGIELNDSLNIDRVPFRLIRQDAIRQFEAGGVVTFSWHMHNPVTGGSAWDTSGGDVVAALLPGGKAHTVYIHYLQQAARFLNNLKTESGTYVPVILRLFHELNGNWFWWGRSHASPEQMRSLWAFTVSYLRDSLHLHHILYAYNTDRFADAPAYLERYPGDDWVDIMGFDIYQAYDIAANQAFRNQLSDMCRLLDSMARHHHKIPALTEFGYNMLPDSTWWTQVFGPAIVPYDLAYILAWRNAGRKSDGSMEFYVPYPGQASAADFKRFISKYAIVLRSEAASLHLYP